MQLTDPNTSAVVLSGIGGIGKSTLAALVLNYAGRERHAGRGLFRREPVLLRINENTTFLQLATNLFAAVDKTMPDLSGAPPQNQAFAIFNALNTVDSTAGPRLIVLDQFENLLDSQSGQVLATHAGVGEFIDALNSQPCACRLLLTSRVRPRGTRSEASISLRVYPIAGLDLDEGVSLLRSQDVTGSETDLHEAVRRCKGHALALTLLSPLLQTYGVTLAILLKDPAYRQLWEGSIAEKLLDRIFHNLPEQPHQLLRACSVYREAIPVEALLAIVANITKAQALASLASLLEQHLVLASSGGYQLHPIVATYAEQHFVVNNADANKQARRAAHALAAHYYQQLAATRCPRPDQRRQISDEQPLIEAVWQLCQSGAFQEAYTLMEQERLFYTLRLWGGNAILLELCQQLLAENWQYTLQEQALIFSNMASVWGVLGQKQEVLKYYEQALRIFGEVGDRGGEGTTLNNLGRVYDALGQKQEALKYYEQALQLHRMVQNPFMEGITLHNIGIIYSSQGDFEVALACILLAKVLFERVQSPSDVDDEVQWIAGLRQHIGENQLASLLAQVEPRAEQIVEHALQEALGEQ